MACKRSAVRSRYSPPKSTVLRRKYGAFLFCSGKKIRGAPLAMQAGQWHPRSQSKPLSDLTLAVFSAPRRQLHAKARQRISTLTFFYGRGWITRAAHLKKPRRGFFPRRTVRRVDAVRIHPPSLREGYYKTETPVPGSDTGVLGGAKQPKSEPLPSGASLAAISSKVMVFVPSL